MFLSIPFCYVWNHWNLMKFFGFLAWVSLFLLFLGIWVRDHSNLMNKLDFCGFLWHGSFVFPHFYFWVSTYRWNLVKCRCYCWFPFLVSPPPKKNPLSFYLELVEWVITAIWWETWVLWVLWVYCGEITEICWNIWSFFSFHAWYLHFLL